MNKVMKNILIGICIVAMVVGCGSEKISNDKITIQKYKGLEVENVEMKISEEELDMAIQTDLQTIELDVEETVAQMGHIVYISYEGKIGGKLFEGGAVENARVVLGESEPYEGMADKIVGHAVGEKFDITLTLPEDFGVEELNGQQVVFSITLKELKKPYGSNELTEEILPYLSETAKTVEEYKEQVRQNMKENNAESERQLLEQLLWEALLKECTVKEYPQDRLKEEKEILKSQYDLEAMMIGMGVDEYLKAANINLDATAKAKICQEYAVELIAEKEKITVSDKLYKKKLQEYATRDAYESAEQYEKDCGKDNIIRVIKQEKVVQILIDTCIQVEPKKDGK